MKINKAKWSLVYLIWGTLASVVYISFFSGGPPALRGVMILVIPFYLGALSLTIFIHPAICVYELIKKYKKKENKTKVIVHLVWSLTFSSVFMFMVFNGYILTA